MEGKENVLKHTLDQRYAKILIPFYFPARQQLDSADLVGKEGPLI
jgi:hypothetical protein|uniref:Uncharacterized protein n=1 Tax=Picea glauca TaxID=3330 RepID=A0A101M5C4_PICGL|nr:hypothetical protein ABT39_MTgene1142 [Picea glauca]